MTLSYYDLIPLLECLKCGTTKNLRAYTHVIVRKRVSGAGPMVYKEYKKLSVPVPFCRKCKSEIRKRLTMRLTIGVSYSVILFLYFCIVPVFVHVFGAHNPGDLLEVIAPIALLSAPFIIGFHLVGVLTKNNAPSKYVGFNKRDVAVVSPGGFNGWVPYDEWLKLILRNKTS